MAHPRGRFAPTASEMTRGFDIVARLVRRLPASRGVSHRCTRRAALPASSRIEPSPSGEHGVGLLRCSASTHALLIAAVLLSWVVRAPSTLQYPVLFNEDGGLLFTHFLNREDVPVLIFYAGYASVGSNLLAWFASALPITWIPYAYMWTSLAIAGSAVSVFYLPRFRSLVSHDGTRFVVCLLFALFPLGNGALVRSLTWSFWPVLTASCMLCLVSTSGRRSPWEWLYLLMNAWASPISSVLLPVYGWRLHRARNWTTRLGFAFLILATIVYLQLNLSTEVVRFAAVSEIPSAPVSHGCLLWATGHTLPAIADRVVFEPVFSNFVRLQLICRGLESVVVVVGAALLACVVLFVARDPGLRGAARRNAAFLCFSGYLVVAITIVSLYARFGPAGLDYRAAFHHRYFWVQQYLLCVSLVVVLSPLRHRITRRSRWFGMTFLVGAALGMSYLDRVESRDPGWGPDLRRFLAQVETCRRQRHGARSESCRLPMVLEQRDKRFPLVVRRFD